MKEEVRKFPAKAEKAALHAAEILVAAGDADHAAGRAYYAMLHTAQALLREEGRRYRKHAGVHAAYGEHFAKTAVLDPKYHRWMPAAFSARIKGDYDIEDAIDVEAAKNFIEQAREFVEAARRYLESQA